MQLNPYLAPINVPDPTALARVQQLCDLADPYSGGAEVDELFDAAMHEINTWHIQRSEFYRRLSAASPGQPYIHAHFFKRHEVLSIPPKQVSFHLTSSGTTGQKSQMFFDDWSMRSAQRMVARIFDYYGWITPDQPVNYLLYSYQPAAELTLGTAFTDNYLCDFAPASSVTYALRYTGSAHEFDPFGCVEALQRYALEGLPVRILGFPAFLYFTLERMRALGVAPVSLPADSLVFLGGGWKGHADAQVDKSRLYALITDQLGIAPSRIRDSFGSVEHCVPYIECDHHNLHAPVWSQVRIRSTSDLRPLPYGDPGFLHLTSPYITSVPAHSVVMGDLASTFAGSDCGCELSTPWFVIHGRAGTSRNKSCAIAAAELLRGMS